MKRIGRADIMLALGAAAGVTLAALGVARPTMDGTNRVPTGAVASVNGVTISNDDYQRAVSAIAADRRDGIDATLRKRAIDRLIDEELLVQRGVELGLPSRDRRVRNDLSAAVIDLIVARAEQAYREPSEADLRELYRGNQFYFRGPDLIRLEQIYVSGSDAEQRVADLAGRARAGESFSALKREANTPGLPLPATAIPAAKLRDYIGSSAARQALTIPAGSISEPIKSAAGARVIRVLERVTPAQPPYQRVRELVRAEHRRRAGDRALRRFFERSRSRSSITIAAERL